MSEKISKKETISNISKTLKRNVAKIAVDNTEITYEHLTLHPFVMVALDEVIVNKKINEHGTMFVSGLIPKEMKSEYIDSATPEMAVTLLCNKDKEKVVFRGIIKDIEVEGVGGDQYRMTLNCLTSTTLMDAQIKSRSFQDINRTYENITKSIAYEYYGGDLSFMLNDKSTGEFIIQYKETDWEFIKRLASRFNEGLYPSYEFETPKVFFGAPNIDRGVILDEVAFKTRKKVNDFRYLGSNYIENSLSLDFVEYELESFMLLELGEKVKYGDTDFYVKSIQIKLIDGVFRSKYVICTKSGLKQPRFTNNHLQGRAIGGHIIGVNRDKVQVHLTEIDKQPPKNGYWFPYQAMYASKDGSGWYCMPEQNDAILASFPSDEDKDVIASSSVSKYESNDPDPKKDRMGDPNIRFIKNPQGMEVSLTPSSVLITSAGGGTITLNDDGTIDITSKKEINLKSDKDISIAALENLNINASKNIEFNSGEKAIIKIAGEDGKIEIKGEEVYTN